MSGALNWDILPLSNVTYNLIHTHMVGSDPTPRGHNNTSASDQLSLSSWSARCSCGKAMRCWVPRFLPMRANVRAIRYSFLHRQELGIRESDVAVRRGRIDRTRSPAISVNNGEPKNTISITHHKKCRRNAHGELTPMPSNSTQKSRLHSIIRMV